MGQSYVFPDSVIEYFPAPGQFINDINSGIPQKAELLTQQVGSGVSLGAFGGRLTVYFKEGISNDPENPYGVDFTIFGNSFSGSSEPGIVQVMKDVNNNRLPDDTWYELAGSLHFSDLIERNYGVCYYAPSDGHSLGVPYTNFRGFESFVFQNEFHTQTYYPLETYFPDYPADSVCFNGNKLNISFSVQNGILSVSKYLFGYADNIQTNTGIDLNLPDNPYTPDIVEGSGGNAMDISWAVNSNGEYIELDKIHFVRIISAVQEDAGVLGEISTEVLGVVDIPSNSGVHGKMNIISMETIPERMIAGSEIELKAVYFEKGHPVEEEINWQINQPAILEILPGNILRAKTQGEAVITASLSSDPEFAFSRTIAIVQPSAVEISPDLDMLLTDKEYLIKAKVFDADHQLIESVWPDSVKTLSDNIEIRSKGNGEYLLKGILEGTGSIKFSLRDEEEVYLIKDFEVINDPDPVRVSFAMQTDNGVEVERKWLSVAKQNILAYVERGGENLQSLPKINLADVISQVLSENGYKSSSSNFLFRSDEHSGDKLYLWQLSKNWEYIYGWGGSLEEGYEHCWVATINGDVYLNDFDRIPVSENDTISLSLKDVSKTWYEWVVIPEKTQCSVDEDIRFYFCLLENQIIDNQVVTNISTSEILDNQLLINDVYSGSLNDYLISGESPAFQLQFNETGVYHIALAGYENYGFNMYCGVSGNRSEDNFSKFQMYPNPFNERLFLRFEDAKNRNIQITDIYGKTIIQKRVFESEAELLIPSLPQGIYLLMVEEENQRGSQKIIHR